MQTNTRRKRMRRKYRKLAAVVAGAAVMSTALFHGFPIARVLAAPNSHASYGAVAEKDRGTVTEKVRERVTDETANPVEVVRDNAAAFGFDAERDSFSLLSKTDSKAIVRVRSHGQTFKVELKRRGDGWAITVIRGIGDMSHPATYTPASFFPGAALINPPDAPVGQRVIFNTDVFDGWGWYEAAYPRDMAFGIALEDPRAAGTATAVPSEVLARTDFASQLLLFAHVGEVAPQGYGVGIARVVRTGNDLTVTVRTKSPRAGEARQATKTDDYLAVSRAGLDFSRTVHITFVDQYGTVLVTYTVVPST